MNFAVGYVRVSTGEQTVLNQRIAIDKWASEVGFHVIYYFEDSAISGRIPATQRNAFKDLLEFLIQEKVDAVLVYELSRVGRTFWDTLDAIKAIERYAPLMSCSPRETFLQTTESSVRKLMLGILTWVAEREREMLVQRTKDGMTRAKNSGKRIGRPVKNLDKDNLIKLLANQLPRSEIAKNLGVCKATLYKELHKREFNKPMQTSRSYSQD
ncbi:MAG TPA: recombinase family protein [Nitrososphaeraceae archaeon]|jgi:DNA invertase Pin-like site-specific DNA recombinase